MPSSALLTEKACTAAAAAAHIARACMHAHNSSSIGRRPPIGSVTRSWIWIRALRMAFSSSLEFGYVVLGLFFPFPNSQSNWQVRLRCLIAADTDRRSHSPLPPGTMSSILLAKHISFEHSVSYPRPVITSRREEKNNKANVFQHPIDSHSQSASSSLISPHFAAGAVGVGRGAASFLATESTGTVLIPRLMTRIAGHDKSLSSENESHCSITSECVRTDSILPGGAGLEHGRCKQSIFSLSIFSILVERLSF